MSRRACITVVIALLLLVIWVQEPAGHDVLITKTRRITEVRMMRKNRKRGPACENVDARKYFRYRVTLWSMAYSREDGSIRSLEKMLKQAKAFSKVQFSPIVLEVEGEPLSLEHRTRLLEIGWGICTVRLDEHTPGSSSLREFAKFRLWDMGEHYSIHTIVFIDVGSYIAGDITPLLTMQVPPPARIAATLDYNGTNWVPSFGTSVLVFHPRQIALHERPEFDEDTLSVGAYNHLNELYSGNYWHDFGFRFSANSLLYTGEDPIFWKMRQSEIKIFSYKIAPWKNLNVLSNWWFNEKNNTGTGLRKSLYQNLWPAQMHRSFSTEITATPLQYKPFPTPDPRPDGNLLSDPRELSPSYVIDPTFFIHTKDRRKIRIPPRINSIVDTAMFPSEADTFRPWVLVFGIAGADTFRSAGLRNLQRSSFFKYRSVWNYHRSPDATVLIKYLLARHPAHDYEPSRYLLQEARKHKDIIYFDVKEGGNIKKGSDDVFERKSLSRLVGMSRKTYAWFAYVADHFQTDYVMKGDDDAYYRLNIISLNLQSFSVPRVYFGRAGWHPDFPQLFRTGGPCITLSFDLVHWIRDSQIAENFTDFAFEDMMPGMWFWEAAIRTNNISECGIVPEATKKVMDSILSAPYSQRPILVHHLKLDRPQDFEGLLEKFPDDHPIPPTVMSTLDIKPDEKVMWLNREDCADELLDRTNGIRFD